VTSDLVVITPELTPGCGGVADYTLQLLRLWAPISNLTVLVASPAVEKEDGVSVKPLAPTRAALLKQLPAAGGNVLLQYSAYGFNPIGYPRALIRSLLDWKKMGGGRLVVMFHEIWTFWPFTNKNFFIQQLHRRALKHLLGVCDAAFTTTDSQAQHLVRLAHNRPVAVIPVGSNIVPNGAEYVQREPGFAVLFGTQATRIRALDSMSNSLSQLAAGGQIRRIVCVGQLTRPDLSERERELLAGFNLTDGFVQTGRLDEIEVSKILSSASFGIFGQHELSCTKSGSFMAYAAHQLNVIAEFADSTKPAPVCWLVAPAELLTGLPQPELDRRAECLRAWQEQNCSWPVIAAKLGRPLGIGIGRQNSP
jgi:hypothetical protein